MKKLIAFVLLIPLISVSQPDSSKMRISFTLQARDCEYIANYTMSENAYEELDSVMKVRFRISSPPSGTGNVQVDSIRVRDLRQLADRLRYDPMAFFGGVWVRFDTAIRAANNTWLNNRLNTDDSNVQTIFMNQRFNGRRRLRKDFLND